MQSAKNKEKKYKIVKNEILVGSALLKDKKITKHFDRNSYMLNHMDENKAYKYEIDKSNINKDDILKSYRNRFVNYRKNWLNQPKKCIQKKYSNEDLKKKNILPLCLDIEVASICDLACPFCFREFIVTPDKIIDDSFCYNLIDQAADLKIPSIKFNWRGEPLLHPKLPEFIDYAKNKGILETIINTNATTLTKKLSEKLIKSGLDFMIYSFDGGSAKTYEKNRPGRFKKNNFDKVYNNIVNFKSIKEKMNAKFPFTKIQMILTKETFNEQKKFFELFNDVVDDVSVSQYTERGGEIADLDHAGLAQYNHELKIHNLKFGSPYMRDAFGKIFLAKGRKPCEQPFQRLLVTYEGRVAMCCHDWGATHPVGFANKKAFNNHKDYSSVFESVKKNKKGFKLLANTKMPKDKNFPIKKVKIIKDIWFGKDIGMIRKAHIKNEGQKIKICKNCSFKDVYDWIE